VSDAIGKRVISIARNESGTVTILTCQDSDSTDSDSFTFLVISSLHSRPLSDHLSMLDSSLLSKEDLNLKDLEFKTTDQQSVQVNGKKWSRLSKTFQKLCSLFLTRSLQMFYSSSFNGWTKEPETLQTQCIHHRRFYASTPLR